MQRILWWDIQGLLWSERDTKGVAQEDVAGRKLKRGTALPMGAAAPGTPPALPPPGTPEGPAAPGLATLCFPSPFCHRQENRPHSCSKSKPPKRDEKWRKRATLPLSSPKHTSPGAPGMWQGWHHGPVLHLWKFKWPACPHLLEGHLF